MYPGAVLIGRTFSDIVRNVITFVVMFVAAYAVGFRIEGTIAEALAATALMFAFSLRLQLDRRAGSACPSARSRRPTRPGSSGCSR